MDQGDADRSSTLRRYLQRVTPANYNGVCRPSMIGFQTAQDMRNFVACVRELFPAAEQTPVEGGIAIAWNGRRLLAKVYPVAIDPEHLRILAQTKTAQEYGRAPASFSRR